MDESDGGAKVKNEVTPGNTALKDIDGFRLLLLILRECFYYVRGSDGNRLLVNSLVCNIVCSEFDDVSLIMNEYCILYNKLITFVHITISCNIFATRFGPENFVRSP